MAFIAPPDMVDFKTLAANGNRAATATHDSLPPKDGSAISMQVTSLRKDSPLTVTASNADVVLFVFDGEVEGTVGTTSRHLEPGGAVLLVDGSTATISTGSEATVLHFVVDGHADSHAPMGDPELFAALDFTDAESATSNRSFQILFDASNGSCHATVFGGMVPPGAAPWHFHQYDEIIATLGGSGRFHYGDTVSPVGRGYAVRIPSRHLHINENVSDTEDMMVIGVFTPAGSPSAAYLPKTDRPISSFDG